MVDSTGYKRFAIVADIETGGFNIRPEKPSKDNDGLPNPIIEIAMVAVSMDTLHVDVDNRYHTLIKPYESPEHGKLTIGQGALDVNGLTVDALKRDGQELDAVCKGMVAWLKDYKGTFRYGEKLPIIVGHNMLDFDLPRIKQMFSDNGSLRSLEDVISTEVHDTLNLAKIMGDAQYFGGRHKLGYVCQRLGVPLSNAHSASADTIANAYMYVEMLKRLRGAGEEVNLGDETKKFREDYTF